MARSAGSVNVVAGSIEIDGSSTVFPVTEAVALQLAAEHEAFAALGAELRHRPPLSLLTVARGSSDHAAHYAAYLVMARLGRLVTSLPMSLLTLYGANLDSDGLLALIAVTLAR